MSIGTHVYRYAQRGLSEVVSIDYFPRYNRPGMSSGSELALQIQAKGGQYQVLFLCSRNFVFIARLPEPGFPGAGPSLQDLSSHTTLIMSLSIPDRGSVPPPVYATLCHRARPTRFLLAAPLCFPSWEVLSSRTTFPFSVPMSLIILQITTSTTQMSTF